ncbi:MAG: HEAT repeat domain-containing protein [Deltaproteobacteria bacterium]|nr:HEAT repeat domain-containing protein [Deltaproteobacteria bacterium]
MTKRIQTPIIVSVLALGLVGCAGGSTEPDGLRSAQGLTPSEVVAPSDVSPAEASADAVAVTPAVAVEKWRPWMDAEVERLRNEQPEYFDTMMSLEARTTRAGFPRISGPLVRNPDAAPILLYRLLSKSEPVAVRAAIVDALPRTMGDYSAALAELMTLETEPRVRELIAASLYRAAAPYALDGLALGLADVDAKVRAEALRSVGRRKDGDVLASAVVAALSDADEAVQIEAARAAGNLQVEAAKAGLVGKLTSDSGAVRRHSLRALSLIDAEYTRSLAQLTTLQADADPKVARVAATIAAGD